MDWLLAIIIFGVGFLAGAIAGGSAAEDRMGGGGNDRD